MKIVDLVDDIVPPIGRRLISRAASRFPEPELEAEPDDADDEAHHETPEGPEFIASAEYFSTSTLK